MSLVPGTKLGRYEIRSKIGEGGRGRSLPRGYFSKTIRSARRAFRVVGLGGVREKILTNTQSTVALSPDGSQLAFGRYLAAAAQQYEVRLANVKRSDSSRRESAALKALARSEVIR